MQIVIDIPDNEYTLVKNREDFYVNRDNIVSYVRNGTPLPKGHGRLIDADDLIRELGSEHIGGIDAIMQYRGTNTWEDGLHTAWRDIESCTTILEADKEVEHDSKD